MADHAEAEESEGQAPARNWRKELEDRAKTAEDKAADLERRLAFTEAGLTDLSPKQVKALLSAHEGDISADAIKATADELGFGPPPKVAEEEVDPEQAQREQELATLTKLANSPAPGAPDPQTSVDEIRNMSPEAIQSYLYGNADQFGTPPQV